MSVLFLSTDLVFSSRLAAAASRHGTRVTTGASLDAALAQLVAEPKTLVILDLSTGRIEPCEVVTRLRAAAPNCAIVAYAPHVHEERLRTAVDAGCDLVLTRGQFDRQMDELIARYAATP
jgi:DNA-binding NarL/FixJ family response regulator